MTYAQMRQAVLDSRSDTLIAQRFREAFGLRAYEPRQSRTITHAQYRKRNQRRAIMRLMSQRIGAMDRPT